MNLDELKTAWKNYDRKLQYTQEMNEKIIISLITERSDSRFVKVKRQYILGFLWMLICLAFGIIVIFTNPFDYVHSVQYVPMIIFCTGLIILLAGMGKSYSELQRVAISHFNVDDALRRIINVYEKPRKFFYYVVIVFLFSQVVLLPLSFLPKNIEQIGFWPAMAERLIPISISAFLLFAAYKLGAFKERNAEKFKDDLNELQTLKAMRSELTNENV